MRDYEPVAAWAARGGAAATFSFKPATAADAAHPRSVNLVVVDAATGRPVQAVKVALAAAQQRRRSGEAVRSLARKAARSSAPISGLPANGSVGLLACMMSSRRVCTLPSAFGWL